MIIAEKRRKIKSVFLIAVSLLLISELAFMLISTQRVLALIILFVFFIAFNVLEATQPSMVSKIAPAGAKGTATGIYSTCQVLGVFGGGALGGWLLQQQGANAVFLLNAVLVLIWLVVAWSMKPPHFLASVLIPLRGQDHQVILDKLRAVDGVAEAIVVASENTIYLKVDQRRVNRKQLAAIVDGDS